MKRTMNFPDHELNPKLLRAEIEEANIILDLLQDDSDFTKSRSDLDDEEISSTITSLFDCDPDHLTNTSLLGNQKFASSTVDLSISPSLGPISTSSRTIVRDMSFLDFDDNLFMTNEEEEGVILFEQNENDSEKTRKRDASYMEPTRDSKEERVPGSVHINPGDALEYFITFHFLISRNIKVLADGGLDSTKFEEEIPPSMREGDTFQRVEALLGLRRGSLHDDLVQRILAAVEAEPTPGEAQFAIGEILLESVGRSSAALFHGKFIIAVAEAVYEQVSLHGKILPLSQWPERYYVHVKDKLLSLHRDENLSYDNKFHRIHYHFKDLFSLAEVELAILSSCSCSKCLHGWNLDSVDRSDAVKLLQHYVIEKSQTHQALLILHKRYSANGCFSTQVHNQGGSLLKFASWEDNDINIVLKQCHSESCCTLCQSQHSAVSKRRRKSPSSARRTNKIDPFNYLFVDSNPVFLVNPF